MTARAKLTDAQIAEIRALADAEPGLPKREIARRYGVHHAQISRLLAGKAHAPSPVMAGPDPAIRADPGPLRMIPWGRIAPNLRNVRSVEAERGEAAEADLLALASSILERGVLQPLRVEPFDQPQAIDGAAFVLVDGHRRWRALQQLFRQHEIEADYPVPCVVAAPQAGPDLALDQLAANLARRDMHPLDEAEAFRRLVDAGRDTAAIAAAVGRTQRHVQSRIALGRRLSAETKAALREGRITLAQAEALRDADAFQQAHVLAALHRFPTEAAIRDFLRPAPPPAPRPQPKEDPLPTVSAMLASGGVVGPPDPPPLVGEVVMGDTAEAFPQPSSPGLTRGSTTSHEANAVRDDVDPPPSGPASDTAGAGFPPFRHFRVVAASPGKDNMPDTLTLENIITGRSAAYVRRAAADDAEG